MTNKTKHVLDLVDKQDFPRYSNGQESKGFCRGYCWKEGREEFYVSTNTLITEKYPILNPDYTSEYGKGHIEVERGLREKTLYQFFATRVTYTPIETPKNWENISFTAEIVKTWKENKCRQVEPLYQTIKSYKKPKAEIKPRIVMQNSN